MGVDYAKKYSQDLGGVLAELGVDEETEVHAKGIGRLEARLLWAKDKEMDLPPYFLKSLRNSVEMYRGLENFEPPVNNRSMIWVDLDVASGLASWP